MNTIKTLIIVALIGSIQIVQAQDVTTRSLRYCGSSHLFEFNMIATMTAAGMEGPGPLTTASDENFLRGVAN